MITQIQECTHNNIESNMCQAYCKDCGKVLEEKVPTPDWQEEYFKRFLGVVTDYQQEKELLYFISSLLSSQAHALKEQIVEKIRGSIVIMSKENPTFLKQDGVSYDFEKNDGRRHGLKEVLDLLSAIESIEI